MSSEIDVVIKRLEAIEQGVRLLVEQGVIREHYSIAEFAKIAGRSEFTCREWCRLGRVTGMKKRNGRGLSSEWAVTHEEVLRFQREGLLPKRAGQVSAGQAEGDGKTQTGLSEYSINREEHDASAGNRSDGS